ncbi:GntR family transcriptional regulator [Acuticoccus mangrovi]|uniref:GntR family transcriptional regulator n=1 Tax=Acuticoccus mangrovi TaxID=2796142 RepID=A0A934MM62_9HYPH|nr:GntR family transcriptional regulator [Acuticoccus mangrovi]
MDEIGRKKGLGEQAFERLKHDIVWCHLSPGAEVSEAHLCQRYGLGKAPIRHALSRLVENGYVMAIPRRGHVITPITLQSVKDIFDMRLLLEPAAVERACGRVDEARLRQLDAECEQNYEPGNVESEARFMAANRRFHMEIARASGNARLAASLEQIMEEMIRPLHLGFVIRERPSEFNSEHSALIDAVVGGAPDEARRITAEHIESVRALVIDGILTRTSILSANIAPA